MASTSNEITLKLVVDVGSKKELGCWDIIRTSKEGYVTDNCNYMVMDDPVVSPMSTIIPVFALLKRFNITDIRLLEEETVKIDLSKGLELLKASMESKTALADAFIPK